MIGSRTLKQLRRFLVKKAEAERHYLTEDNLVFEFILTNFLFFKEIHIEFWNNGVCSLIESELTKKDKLKVYIPLELLEMVETDAEIKVFINNKAAWLTEHPSYEDGMFNESLLINKHYLTTRVKKVLLISKRFSEYRFSSSEVFADVVKTSYNQLMLELDLPMEKISKKVEIFMFKNRQFLILQGEKDVSTGLVRISDFSELSIGIWRLFIKIGDMLHPMQAIGGEIAEFASLHHQIRPIQRARAFYLEGRPHTIQIESIQIENVENWKFRISMALIPEDNIISADYTLILDDVKSGKSFSYAFDKENDFIKTDVPLADLIGTIFAKRFFILKQNEEPKILQFVLAPQQLTQTTAAFKLIADSQYVSLRFYRRKDKSLGLKFSQPKIRKVINKIDGFKLDGFIGSTDGFINSTVYLLVEDRLSLESRQLPIHGNFTVDLSNWNLIDLKSKNKTIFDFFVVVKTDAGDVIRKEKIKYRKANYKKDAFYSYTVLRDEENNEHHFMFSTTPFNNLKIETFTVPADILIPADVSTKDPNVWLIGERSNTAQDNGIVLFHWLTEHTNVEAYYVIEGDSLDYEPIQHMKNVLVFGSPEHFEVAFRAGVLLCTHDIENILPYKPARGFFGYENTKKIFLQHGVLGRKNVEYHKRNYELPFDLFIVSSEPEKEAVVMEEMGYSDEEVAVTGLARFDRLVQNKKPRDILLMPTWRDWINTDEAFLASEYYLTYTKLIQNEKLLRLLDEHNINLNFYPHYRAQNYFQNGIRDMHERIEFIPLGSVTVQRLLIRHALLITDYSTVSFDFTLLDKPVVFYHFDAERFFRRGILRPIDETFIGGIASHEEVLVSIIEDRILHDFANFDIDISGIIKYRDQDNCRRIYESVCGLLVRSSAAVDGMDSKVEKV